MERDFSETQVSLDISIRLYGFEHSQVLCRLVVNYDEMVTKEHALLNRIQVVAYNLKFEAETAKR